MIILCSVLIVLLFTSLGWIREMKHIYCPECQEYEELEGSELLND